MEKYKDLIITFIVVSLLITSAIIWMLNPLDSFEIGCKEEGKEIHKIDLDGLIIKQCLTKEEINLLEETKSDLYMS